MTPKILAQVKSNPALSKCPWCKEDGTLEHVLLECALVEMARSCFVWDNTKLLSPWKKTLGFWYKMYFSQSYCLGC